jgi:hypothetical protein
MNLAVVGASVLVSMCLPGIALSPVVFPALAQDGAKATVEALQTRVAELEAENSRLMTAVAAPPVEAAASTPTARKEKTPASAEVVELAPGLELLSYRFVYSGLYRADSDEKATFVLGEMRNTTNQALDAPGLKFVLLDGEGNIVGDINGDPILPVIQPGETMPFESAIFGDEPEPTEWETEQIEICGAWGSTDNMAGFDPTGLELRDVEETETGENLSVSGSVFNGAEQPAEGVYVKAAVYDEGGRFAGWFWTALDVAIPAGKSARFSLDGSGDPQDPLGVAGPGYSYELWVGFDSPFGAC